MLVPSRCVLVVALGFVACAEGGGSEPVVLEGSLGFEVAASVALICPPDVQGQFMKVYIEGTTPDSTCDMDHPRGFPTTCEDRQAYLDAVSDVCLGAPSVASENLPMLDYLLKQEGSAWVDLDYVPLTVCDETGNEAVVGLFGNTLVTEVEEDVLHLDFTLSNEEGDELLLAGGVDVPVCR